MLSLLGPFLPSYATSWPDTDQITQLVIHSPINVCRADLVLARTVAGKIKMEINSGNI